MKPLLILLALTCLSTRLASAPPNIVLILADDLGATDLACTGSDLHETPHIDQLARSGTTFTHAYSPSPVCSPTRASLLTGKNPARLHMTIWSEGSLNGPTNHPLSQAQSLHDLPHSETTIAKHLQNQGYLTAVIGKWHLGDANHAPETQGFDINVGGTHWGAPTTYWYPYRGSGRFGQEFRYVPHLELGQPHEYLTDRLTSEALRVIHHAAQNQQRFFLLLSHHAPHTPIEAKPDDITHFEKKLHPELRHQNPVYAAMIKSLDDSVGRIMKSIRQLNLEQDTLVIFASDNGGYIGRDRNQTIPVTTNTPFRSGKGSLYEGGLRIPLIIHWPGVTTANTQCPEPVTLTDLFPTLMAATHTPLPPHTPCDGLDLSPLLRHPTARLNRNQLIFHYPHYYHAPPTTPCSALLTPPFKLITFYEDQHQELFNLMTDPSESTNLAPSSPNITTRLQQQLDDHLQSLNANLPTPNPMFQRF